jgi:hypothetical protein
MAVGTGNITLTQVKTEIQSNSTAVPTSLQAAKLVAIPGGWNATYSGSQDRLSNFKGYVQESPALTLLADPDTVGSGGGFARIYVTSNCTWSASYVLYAGNTSLEPATSIVPTTGTGDDIITFNVFDANESPSQYIWRVTVVTTYGFKTNVSRTVDIFMEEVGGGGGGFPGFG